MIMLDKYEIKARILPGILLCVPVLITIGAIGIEKFDWLTSILGSTTIMLTMSYGLSMFMRAGGIKLQEKSWIKWGGPPSTRFLRWRDKTLSDQKKKIIHEKVKKDFGIELLSAEEENLDPSEADRLISDAFNSIRQNLREKKKNQLWEKHNIEYGFYRNFLGSWPFGLVLAILGSLVLLFYFFNSAKNTSLVIAFGLNILYSCLLVIYVVDRGEKNLKHAAEQYTISAIEAYLSINNRYKHGN